MNDNRVNKYVMQWLVPGGIMLLIIIFSLVHFSVVNGQKEREEVEKRLIVSAQGYATGMAQTFTTLQKSAETAAAFMGQMSVDENVNQLQLLQALNESTDAYEAVICDATGTGYRLNGESVNMSSLPYFQQILSGAGQILFTENDGLNEKPALIVTAPILWYQNATGYVICFYDTEVLKKQLKAADFGTGTFFVLMEKEGKVAALTGSADTAFWEQSEDYFTFLKQNSENKKQVEKMYTQIHNGLSDICYVSLQREQRAIIYATMKKYPFCLLVGINEAYIDTVTKGEWASVRSMVWQIIVILLVFVGAVVVINIVSKIRENEKSRELADKADTDLLTDLYNKAATERKIKEYLAAHPGQLGLMFVLDIDNFKKINDTMGHAFGDEVLHTLGIQIRAEFRATDILGRTGGDEFTVFLCNMKEEAIIQAEAHRLERFFQNFQAGEYVKYSATASIGAAVFPRDAKDFEGLYKAADHALYVAKKRGKNQLAFYGDDK